MTGHGTPAADNSPVIRAEGRAFRTFVDPGASHHRERHHPRYAQAALLRTRPPPYPPPNAPEHHHRPGQRRRDRLRPRPRCRVRHRHHTPRCQARLPRESTWASGRSVSAFPQPGVLRRDKHSQRKSRGTLVDTIAAIPVRSGSGSVGHASMRSVRRLSVGAGSPAVAALVAGCDACDC